MGGDVARERLDTALAEQVRLTQGYEKAVGTSQEIGAYLRLRAANLQVARCQRLLRAVDEDEPGPVAASA